MKPDFALSVRRFAEAASAVLENWHAAEEELSAPAEGYPYPQNFEEIVHGAWEWCRAQNKEGQA